MNIERVVVGILETNCYVLTIGDECIVIDPGDDFFKIKETIGQKKVVGCLLTHGHFDHIGALNQLLKEYKLELNHVKSDKFHYKVIKTPGHTSDSVTYYFEKEAVMFTGDFLFKHSIGRTDLGGNDLDMINSLELIKEYPDKVIVYPGHGNKTILGTEKNYFRNYYLK